MKVVLIKVDGFPEDITPQKNFTLKELQSFVGGYIEIVRFPDGREIVMNEGALYEGLLYNNQATALWQRMFPIREYPHNNHSVVLGDVLVMTDYPWQRD